MPAVWAQIRVSELEQGYVSLAGGCDDGMEWRDVLRRSRLAPLLRDPATAAVLGEAATSDAATGGGVMERHTVTQVG